MNFNIWKMKFKRTKSLLSKVLPILILTGLCSCHPFFFEDQKDCEVHHYIKFEYDLNLKWANAFASEVPSVNLYVFDSEGLFIKEYQGTGEELKNPSYSIEVDLPAGDYKFLAWCGLRDAEGNPTEFSVPEPEKGVTDIQEMSCILKTMSQGLYGENGNYSYDELEFMYWGYLEAYLPDNRDGQSYEYTISLTKDTNHIRIILQDMSGVDMQPDDYRVEIVAANGDLSWDNELQGNQLICYQPWNKENDEVGIGNIDVTDGDITYVKGLVADLSIDRMTTDESKSMLLKIYNTSSGELIASVPLIQYALLSKRYYELAYKHQMTDQEFLDREDEYIMTFFLVNGKWMDAYIDIQQWRIVLHDYDITP